MRTTTTLRTEALRADAKDAWTKLLSDAHQRVLNDAINGLPVDSLELNAALMAVMATAATRKGTSWARRLLAAKIQRVADHNQARMEGRSKPAPAIQPRELSPAELEVYLNA